MPSLKTILQKRPLADATLAEMLEFVELENIEVAPKDKRSKASLAEVIRLAGCGDEITVLRADAALALQPNKAHTALDRWDGQDETERWVMFQLMSDGTDTAPVYAGVGIESVYLRRGVVVVCRERYFDRIAEAKERHREQKMNEVGAPAQHFSEVPVIEVQRYPFTFLGTLGYVKDGPPSKDSMPHGAELYYGNAGTADQLAA